jgi:hypothetical protein
MAFSSSYIRTPVVDGNDIQDSDSTNPVLLLQAPDPLGAVVTKLILTSTSVAAHVVTFTLANGAAGILGSISVPAGAGHGAVAAVEALSALILPNGGELVLPSGESLSAYLEVALGTSEVLSVLVLGGSF